MFTKVWTRKFIYIIVFYVHVTHNEDNIVVFAYRLLLLTLTVFFYIKINIIVHPYIGA